MDKIVCVGWCDADDVINYGQVLQGISMMVLLRKYQKKDIIYASYLPRSFKEVLFYIKGHISFTNGNFLSSLKARRLINKITRKYNIKLVQVHSLTALNKICNGAKYLICGSDQIWHPQNYDPGYFLNFGNKRIRRISYAASLPKSESEVKFAQIYEKVSYDLKRIDYISVREEGSVPFISELSGKRAISVLDPTYLIGRKDWEKIVEFIKVPEKYMFVYIPNGMDKRFVNYVNKIKNHLSINNVFVMTTRGDNLFTDANILKFVSVGQFLYLIMNATCIVTSSFHAVVFSTIFEKAFWCYDVPNVQRGEDIRLKDLLSKLNLMDRLINELKESYLNNVIDYSAVKFIIENQKKKSYEYLDEAFS